MVKSLPADNCVMPFDALMSSAPAKEILSLAAKTKAPLSASVPVMYTPATRSNTVPFSI